jgi:hypothetical protein
MEEKEEAGGSWSGGNEGQEAAEAHSGRTRFESGSAFSSHRRLHSAFEVASKRFASSFQDSQTMSLCWFIIILCYKLIYSCSIIMASIYIG